MYEKFREQIDAEEFLKEFENNTQRNLIQIYSVLNKKAYEVHVEILDLMSIISKLNYKRGVLKQKTIKKIFTFV